MTGSSTSRHLLSADRGLSKLQRLSWLACNLLNNTFPRRDIDRKINERKFHLSEQRLCELWDSISEGVSPSRRLSDLFWLSLPWSALLEQLGSVNAVEVGCGSGAYGRLLEKILGEGLGRYLGVDIESHELWTAGDNPRLAFQLGRAGDVRDFLTGANLVLTQSALEHFEEDLHYFSQISSYVHSQEFPILQVHLIPSASCITTFPWHGIREYTPRTISRITRLFGSETAVHLFSLGGPNCNRIHRKYITWPHLRREADLRLARKQEYDRAVRLAILLDFSSGSASAAFYALVLASNFKKGSLRLK